MDHPVFMLNDPCWKYLIFFSWNWQGTTISFFSSDSAAGSSTDWAYAGANIKYSFALELRDTGKQGFILSNTLIVPTAEENFAAVRAMVNAIESEF